MLLSILNQIKRGEKSAQLSLLKIFRMRSWRVTFWLFVVSLEEILTDRRYIRHNKVGQSTVEPGWLSNRFRDRRIFSFLPSIFFCLELISIPFFAPPLCCWWKCLKKFYLRQTPVQYSYQWWSRIQNCPLDSKQQQYPKPCQQHQGVVL